MRYSTRTRYGLRFLINLAGRPAGSCVQFGGNRPRGRRFRQVSRADRTRLAPCGHFAFRTRGQGRLCACEIPGRHPYGRGLRAFGRHISPVECLHGAKSCEREGVCPTRWFWRELDDHMRMFLKGMTLARFVERERALKTEKGTFPVEMDGPACFHALHRTPPEGGGNA